MISLGTSPSNPLSRVPRWSVQHSPGNPGAMSSLMTEGGSLSTDKTRGAGVAAIMSDDDEDSNSEQLDEDYNEETAPEEVSSDDQEYVGLSVVRNNEVEDADRNEGNQPQACTQCYTGDACHIQ